MSGELGPAGRKIEWLRLHPDYSQGVHGFGRTQEITLLPKDGIQRSLRWLTSDTTKKGALIGFGGAMVLDTAVAISFSNMPTSLALFIYGYLTLFPTLVGTALGFGLAQDRDGWATGNYKLVDKNQSQNVKT